MEIARRSRIEILMAAAAAPCVCHGAWSAQVAESFRINGIDAAELCRDIFTALKLGRSERVPVIVLAGARGGEGKSLFLKPLLEIYGHDHVFSKPEKGNFPLVDLPGKRVALLDEWRFSERIISTATQCVWYDGSVVPVNTPQNTPGSSGHYLYRGSAPIFVTSKLDAIEALQELAADDPKTGKPKDADASMVLRRLKVHVFSKRIPPPPPGIPYCGHCFANAILNEGEHFSPVSYF